MRGVETPHPCNNPMGSRSCTVDSAQRPCVLAGRRISAAVKIPDGPSLTRTCLMLVVPTSDFALHPSASYAAFPLRTPSLPLEHDITGRRPGSSSTRPMTRANQGRIGQRRPGAVHSPGETSTVSSAGVGSLVCPPAALGLSFCRILPSLTAPRGQRSATSRQSAMYSCATSVKCGWL